MSEINPNTRLEAFSDGVFAIALTLLIIEIKVPHTDHIHSSADLWLALRHLAPSIFAFILSFVIILITWVNHHAAIRLVHKSSSAFIYANGFLLLTVVFMPFPTALLGEYIMTDYASPAVILYTATMSFQAIGWILIGHTVLKDQLGKNDKSILATRKNTMFGYFAFILYALCALLAVWFPMTIAIITTLIWLLWLIWGISIKHE